MSRRPPRSRASTSSTSRAASRWPTARRSIRARTRWTRWTTRSAPTPRSSRSRPACSSCASSARTPDDPKPDRWWVVQDRPGLSGTDIKSPEQSFDQTVGNQPIVTFNFTDQGRDAFQAITRRVAERGVDNAFGQDPQPTSQHFAIALDDELVSAPLINWRENPDGIDGSTGAQISGSFTIQSAQDLAKILKIGALPLELNEVSRSQVSASLGKQALDQGLKAGIAGFIIVALFLIIYYRVLGVVATVALMIYALYFYAIVKLIPITLTLPGIAGLVLTLGVAADANIVVFERVKEEVRAGRPIATAITTGYRKGLTAIIDANIVTFLVAFILFIIATAGVQGFAFTLGIGVILSLFTAVLATQAILYSLRGTRLIRSKAALGAGEQRVKFKIDYMGKAKWFFSMSGVILLVCALAMSGRGINFGIDFEGGTRITAPLEQAGDGRSGARRGRAARPRRREDPDARRTRRWATTSSRSRPRSWRRRRRRQPSGSSDEFGNENPNVE